MYLDRSAVTAPAGLASYDPNLHKWKDVTAADRAEMRNALGALQKERCAYCQRPLGDESKRPHLEHFEQRSRAPHLTFEWSNLFWSCSQPGHCGKHKDSPGIVNGYARPDLVKPDVDDPRQFLEFTSEGAVNPRRGLSATQTTRASETIRVFALDAGGLRTARKGYLAVPRHFVFEVAALPVDEARELLEAYADDFHGSPYEAAILDVLGVS